MLLYDRALARERHALADTILAVNQGTAGGKDADRLLRELRK